MDDETEAEFALREAAVGKYLAANAARRRAGRHERTLLPAARELVAALERIRVRDTGVLPPEESEIIARKLLERLEGGK